MLYFSTMVHILILVPNTLLRKTLGLVLLLLASLVLVGLEILELRYTAPPTPGKLESKQK